MSEKPEMKKSQFTVAMIGDLHFSGSGDFNAKDLKIPPADLNIGMGDWVDFRLRFNVTGERSRETRRNGTRLHRHVLDIKQKYVIAMVVFYKGISDQVSSSFPIIQRTAS